MSGENNKTEPAGEELTGWDWFDKTEAEVAAANKRTADEQEELAMKFAAAFTTPQGQEVLDHLVRWQLDVKGFDPERGFHDGAAYGFYREGQNSMIQYIRQMVKRGADAAQGAKA